MERFSAEYVELCLTESRNGGVYELLATHEWQVGDWWAGDSDGPPIFCWDGDESEEAWSPKTTDSAWLPLEGDWLDLLEAEGYASIIGIRPAKDGSGYGIQTDEGDDSEIAFGATRLEALARLYALLSDDVQDRDTYAEHPLGDRNA
jgi:hypothetical protein